MTFKAKVLSPFWDKHNGEKHEKGDTIEVSPERFKEILTKGKLVEAVENPPSKKNAKK